MNIKGFFKKHLTDLKLFNGSVHAHLHNTHTLQFEETALMKPTHWTEFQSDFSTRVNYRNRVCVCLRMCVLNVQHWKSCFPLRPQLGYSVHITGKKTSHYEKTKNKYLRGYKSIQVPFMFNFKT